MQHNYEKDVLLSGGTSLIKEAERVIQPKLKIIKKRLKY